MYPGEEEREKTRAARVDVPGYMRPGTQENDSVAGVHERKKIVSRVPRLVYPGDYIYVAGVHEPGWCHNL